MRRFLSTTTVKQSFKNQYDPAKMPQTNKLTRRKHLEWLMQRPDPAPLEKTIVTQLPAVTFSEIYRPQPLYEYLNDQVQQGKLKDIPGKVFLQSLPPITYSSHGKYDPRELTQAEKESIKQQYSEGKSAKVLALQFKCSKKQTAKLILKHRYATEGYAAVQKSLGKSLTTRWRWWYGKKYASAQYPLNPSNKVTKTSNQGLGDSDKSWA